MAVIIGSSTAVTLEFPTQVVNTGIISIDWSFGSNIQRLYTLGLGAGDCGPLEYASVRSSDVSVNFSIYGGETPEMDICPPTEGCVDSPAKVIVTISPGACGTQQPEGLNARPVYINSYGYNKDRTGFGTETFAGTAYVQADADVANKKYVEPEPDYNILGIAEGTIEGETDDLASLQTTVGAKFRDITDVVTVGRGSVAASQISIGEYTLIHHGTFQSVGNSVFWEDGVLARANVTLNIQPVYVGDS